MKRNLILIILLTFTLLLVTACGQNTSNNKYFDKFEGTWVAYDKTKGNKIQELTIENIGDHLLVSLDTYSYKPLMDYFSSGIDIADRTKSGGETAPANADYILVKNYKPIHNDLSIPSGNKLDVSGDLLIFNEKDNTLIMDNIVFKKKTGDNSIQTYLPNLQENMKQNVLNDRKEEITGAYRPKPTIQFNFSFDDSILDTAQ